MNGDQALVLHFMVKADVLPKQQATLDKIVRTIAFTNPHPPRPTKASDQIRRIASSKQAVNAIASEIQIRVLRSTDSSRPIVQSMA